MSGENLTYAGAGVDYGPLDRFKRMAQNTAGTTDTNVSDSTNGEFRVVAKSRGESVFLLEAPDSYVAHVEEGLGTKSLVADEYTVPGWSHYMYLAQDTVAMIVNDMVTLGALPLSVAMHLAVGDSAWFANEKRSADLLEGWRRACNLARCTWGGGETPVLKDVIVPGAALLSGSAIGLVKPKERLLRPEQIRHGDAIVLIESSGIHANGLTMARKIAEKLPTGYLTLLRDGRTYGETLLDPTHIYVGVVEDCIVAGVDIHYAVHITGHGWRKLMRAPQSLTYVVETLPRQLPIFDFIQEHGPVDDREAYGTFNMGAGFALYVPHTDVGKVLSTALKLGFRALYAGHIENGDRRVVIEPKRLVYAAETLGVR